MNKTKTKLLRIILSLFIFGGLIFGAYRLWFKKPAIPDGQRRIVKVVKGEIKPTLAVTGTVRSENETGVNFKVSGELTAVKVKVGDAVKAGQELAKIDAKGLRRQVTIAKANLDSANAKMDQFEAGLGSDYDIELQQAAVIQTRENYQEALDNLAQATLTSLKR